MSRARRGFRVGIVGDTSLLGKELATVLEERRFPVARLLTFATQGEDLALPIVDLEEPLPPTLVGEHLVGAELDLVFLAAPSPRGAPFLESLKLAENAGCVVIDLGAELSPETGAVLCVPHLSLLGRDAQTSPGRRLLVSPHPAAIMISTPLLRLAAHAPLKRAVAAVFAPASEIGPRAIEELQRQTVSLLSLQKIPQTVFGAQLAFNMLSRFGRNAAGGLAEIESRIRRQLGLFLGDQLPMPALRMYQAPIFYSLALSLYVEMERPALEEALGKVLEGERVCLRRSADQSPSPVESAGSADILVDALFADPAHPGGIWLWATADNIRLAAENAVAIAEEEKLRR